MDNLYKEDSIKTVSPREFTRMKPGVYCGSTEYSTQLLKEIFTNAVDEHRIGHGNKIEIIINTKENTYTVIDNGQGFPVNKKHDEEGRTVLEAAFSVLNTSGKYDEDGTYNGISNGSFGIGGKLTNFLSKGFYVTSSIGNGEAEQLEFKDGLFQNRKVLNFDNGSGTSIQFMPDEQFFKNPQIDFNYFRKYLKEVVALCPKLTVEFTVDDKKEIYKSKNGLSDLVDDKVKGKELIKNRFIYNDKQNKLGFNIVLTYTTNYSDDITAYVNCGLTESGTHLTAIKSSITRMFNKYANENNLLKKGEANLTGAELSEGLVLIFNMDAPGVQYDSQTKARVTEIDKTLLNKVMSTQFYQWLQDNPKDAKIIIEKALEARRAKEAAKKAREAVRKPKKQKGLKAKMQLSDKLADCNSKNRKECELFIVEGDSAAGSAKSARTNAFQAIMPLRGKVLNTEKITETKAMENKEISTLINVIGTGIKEYCDYKKSRYGKIILLTDADVDGSHIDILILTFLYKYMRPLIEQGMIYLAVPPLYRVRKGNNYKYLKNEEELDEYRKHNSNFEIQRFKGLM